MNQLLIRQRFGAAERRKMNNLGRELTPQTMDLWSLSGLVDFSTDYYGAVLFVKTE